MQFFPTGFSSNSLASNLRGVNSRVHSPINRAGALRFIAASWLLFLLHGCASQSSDVSLAQYQQYQSGFQPIHSTSELVQAENRRLDIDPEWVAAVNRHFQADVETVHVPYRKAITAIESLSVAESCTALSQSLVNDALALNPSSLRARYLQMYCEPDTNKKAQIKNDILAITQVLLSTGRGDSLSSPIQIRELAEAYTLLSVLGWYVFDMELVVGKDERIGYKVHALSYERDQFQYVFFENHTLLKKLYQSRSNESLTNRKASLITMRSFMSDHESSALAFIGRNLMHRREYQELLDTLEGRYQDSPVLSVLYAEALLKSGQNAQAAELMGHIELKSTPGFVDGLMLQALVTQVIAVLNIESTSPTEQADALTSNPKAPRGLENIQFLLQKVDYLTEQHMAIKLLVELILGHPQSTTLLSFWLNHYSNSDIVAGAIIDSLTRMTLDEQQQEKIAILTMMLDDISESRHTGEAAWLLGQMHHIGKGVDKDIEQAFVFYRKAAEMGFPKAQTALGEIYANGMFGFQKNRDIAENWLNQAIAQNHAPAKILKANLLLEQPSKAATLSAQALYREAIEQGQPRAYCELGMMYNNDDADVSVREGVDLLQLGANAGQAKCMFMLGLTFEVMLNDYQQSRKWYLQAVEAGSSAAMSNLGRHYDHGIGVDKNYAQALKYYQQAVDAGNVVANVNLGLMYENGKGVPQDYQLAAALYSKAAKRGNAQALHNLGIMYAHGNHFQRDLYLAFNFFDEAAAKGNAWSMFNLASAYRYGMGTNKNIKQAIHYYALAAEQGISDAFCKLSVLYQDYPAFQNLDLARAYSNKASEYYGVNCADLISVILRDEQGKQYQVELSGDVTMTKLVSEQAKTLTKLADLVFKR